VLQASQVVDDFAFQAAVAQVARQLKRRVELGSRFACSACCIQLHPQLAASSTQLGGTLRDCDVAPGL